MGDGSPGPIPVPGEMRLGYRETNMDWLYAAVGLVVVAAVGLGTWGIYLRSRHPLEEDL